MILELDQKGAIILPNYRTFLTSTCAALAIGTAALSPFPAFSQSEAQVAQGGLFEEIIVTARKREERLQAVPIAITAFSADDLEAKNVKTLGDLRFVTPSLSVQPDTFRQDTINITIRGLRNYPSNGIQFDTATAVYVNGVYLSRVQGLTGALFDIDNVQVLKGPQGTLVGRNATGGAVLYSTKEPTDEFEGQLTLGVGDYGRYELQGIVNVPLTDKIFARAGFSYTEAKGYLKNIFNDPNTGEVNETPALGSRKTAGNFSLKFQPDDSTKLLLRGDFDTEHHTGVSYHLLNIFEGTKPTFGVIGTNPAPTLRPSICQIPLNCNAFIDLDGRVSAPYYSDPYNRIVNDDPLAYRTMPNSLARQADDFWSIEQANSNYNVGHFHSASGTFDRSFGDTTVKFVGGYRWTDTEGHAYSRGAAYNNLVVDYVDPDYNAYTGELTVNGVAISGALDWTIGAFYFNESVSNQGSVVTLFSSSRYFPQAVAGRQVSSTDSTPNSGENTSYAGYAQVTYDIDQYLRLTGGVRYTIDKRSAHIEKYRTIFPATAATSATVTNGAFNPEPYVFRGITYAEGSTLVCSLTDEFGATLPLDRCAFDINKTFKEPTWTASIDYDVFDGALAYFTIRRGYKSGAINSDATNPAVTIAKPEKVDDFELGLKADWFLGDVPVRTNLAAFYTIYKNIQVQQGLPYVVFATAPDGGPCTQDVFNSGLCNGTSTENVTLNAKRARIIGFEWDFSVNPTESLTLSWNGSYLNGKYTDYSFTPPAGYLQPASGADLTGQPFPLPAWQMSGSATYALSGERLGIDVEEASVTGNVYYQGDFKTVLDGYHPSQKVKGYALLDLRINFQNIADMNVDLSGTVSNVFNKKACLAEPGGTGAGGGAGVLTSTPNFTFGTPNTTGLVQCVPLPPRMASMRFRLAF